MRATREQFGPYLRRLADLMGLKDWAVIVLEDSPDNSAYVAQADCVFGRKLINVALADAFFLQDGDSQRQTIVHELVHAHMAAMHHYLHRILSDEEWEAYKVTMEYGVDGVAEALAPHMPLPPSEKRKR